MAGVNERVIASEPGFCITLHDFNEGNKDNLVITFDSIGGRLEKRGFGTDFLLKNGIDTIHIAQEAKSFYQHLSFEAFGALVRPISSRYKNVFTYGSSLGGYAAIYYAGAVEARAIALSPRLPIDPLVHPYYNNRFSQPLAHDLLNEVVVVSKLAPVICYDPLDKIDQGFYEHRIRPIHQDASVLLIENGQHSVAGTLQKSGVLKDFIFYAVRNGKALDVVVDVECNSRFTSKKAVKLYKAGDISECVRYLNKALSSGSEIRSIELLRKLCLRRVAGVQPDMGLVTASVSRKIFSKYKAGLLEANSHTDYLKFAILLAENLLDFELALKLAERGSVFYLEDKFFEKKCRVLRRVINFYFH